MQPYEAIRDELTAGRQAFKHLDAVQLVKHAFGLRTQAGKKSKRAVLFYLYAEPKAWPGPNGKNISPVVRAAHKQEIETFGEVVANAEVTFVAGSYDELLGTLERSDMDAVRTHGRAVRARFDC
jgi:hypothetical protein